MTSSRFGRIDRRRLVASSVVGGAAILATGQPSLAGTRADTPILVSAQDGSSDVPMFRGNAARTGVMPGPGPDASKGIEPIWKFSVAPYISSSPAVTNGVVYLGFNRVNQSTNLPSEATLFALNANDGSERWRFVIGDTELYASPAVIDGVAYLGAGNGVLYAIDTANGVERWRFTTGKQFLTSPAVSDGMVFVGSMQKTLYAIDSSSGGELWSFHADGFVNAAAVANGTVYFLAGRSADLRNTGNDLIAVDAKSGLEKWRFAMGGFPGGSSYPFVAPSPAVADGMVYILGPQPYGNLYAINADDGTEFWRFSVDGDSSPVVSDGVVYVGSSSRTIYALNAADGTERWSLELDGSFYSSPSVSGGYLYASYKSGSIRDEIPTAVNVIALDKETGIEEWKFTDDRTSSDIHSSPVISSGTIYVSGGSKDGIGYLYALGARVSRLSIGGTARVTEKASLRGGPAPTAVERKELKKDTTVTITGESVRTNDVVWWPVTVDETGDQGWVEASKLEPLTSGPEPTATA
ncbi:MAG: PQQ-binding-like beta-propeller repeat protein [Thermomicrobiales bacterium]